MLKWGRSRLQHHQNYTRSLASPAEDLMSPQFIGGGGGGGVPGAEEMGLMPFGPG
jgi:hypothetical protein